MKKIRVGINGFGRIGRAFFRLAETTKDIEIVAVNDLGSAQALAYVLAHDSVYGKPAFSVSYEEKALVVDGRRVELSHEKEPAHIPWKEHSVDVVVESTGAFTAYTQAVGHVNGGAKRVVITAPAKDEDGSATVLVGINEAALATCTVSSNASCTTNAGSPLLAILDEAIGIEHAVLNTVHAYTASQTLVDGPGKKDLREGRAAAQNIVPTATGAAIAVTKALPAFEGKFDGVSVRVPVVCGSLVDVTFVAKRATSVDEVNTALRQAAALPRWEGIFTVTEEALVSSDIVGMTYGAIADVALTRVVGGTLVKVFAWYDNEMGYAATLLKHVKAVGKYV